MKRLKNYESPLLKVSYFDYRDILYDYDYKEYEEYAGSITA